MKFLRINSFDKERRWNLVQDFLSTVGDSLVGFRYYFKRDKNVLDNHIHTVLLYEENALIGYGHLDRCDVGNIWLGICLVSGKTGKGIGKKIMQNLIDYSDNLRNEEIRLSVDITNIAGKKLYEQFGFVTYNKTDKMYFMKRSKNV